MESQGSLYSWDCVIQMILAKRKQMFKLYSFYVDCGRSGEIEGLFIANEQSVKDSIGKFVYLGEVLGKHSEVSFNLEEDMFIDYFSGQPDAEEKHQKAIDLFGVGTISGCNPFDYIEEELEEPEDE
jgi:hypothetical protein